MANNSRPPILHPEDDIPNDRSAAFEDSDNTGFGGSAGAPKNYDEYQSLVEAMKQESIPSFGGRLFRTLSHNQMNNLVVFAVPSSVPEEVQTNLSRWFSGGVSLDRIPFARYNGSFVGREYTFYKFTLRDGAVSMREVLELSDNERKTYCKDLFPKLVNLIQTYKEETQSKPEFRGKYDPLCSIALDNVFMDPSGELRLVPLVSINGEYPRGFPMEAGTEEANETTDLYTAALLTCQVRSGIEYEAPSKGKRMTWSDDLEPWLRLFASQRKRLPEAVQMIRSSSKEPGAAGQAKPSAPTKTCPRPPHSPRNPDSPWPVPRRETAEETDASAGYPSPKGDREATSGRSNRWNPFSSWFQSGSVETDDELD